MKNPEALADSTDSLRPSPLTGLEPLVEFPALSGFLADSAGGNTETQGDGLNLSSEFFGFCLHASQANVIFHSAQRETSHSRSDGKRGKFLSMDESDVFRANLLRLMKDQGLSEAELSKLAGLNPRGVTDIREGRTKSPKLSTVIALAKALKADPAEMIGLGRRYNLLDDLADFLSQYDRDEQSRFLDALAALPRART